MAGEHPHAEVVARWLRENVQGRLPERQAKLFVSAFNTLWRRAKRTLGEATLLAIGERVLYLARERFPLLAGVSVGPEGLEGLETALLNAATSAPKADLTDTIGYVLTEFLTVLGRLTANILTPALHAELAGGDWTDSPDPLQSKPGNGGEEGTS
jgi:hypothetical protein